MATGSTTSRSPVLDSDSNDFGLTGTLGTNPWVDSLFYAAQWGDNLSINAGEQVGEYKYYFATPDDSGAEIFSSYFADPNYTGWSAIAPVTEEFKNTYRGAYQSWAHVTNLSFVESVTFEGASVIIVNARYNDKGFFDNGVRQLLGSHQGLANLETGDLADLPLITDTNAYVNDIADLGPGSSVFATAIHETGHGIGLSHPHDRGLGVSSSGVFPGLISGDSDGNLSLGLYGLVQTPFTIMSYKRGYTGPTITSDKALYSDTAITPMPLDIAAAQIKYGTNRSTNAGNTLYTFDPEVWQSLYDAGGIDRVTVSKRSKYYSRNIKINLRPAEMNAVQPHTGLPMEQYEFNVETDIDNGLNSLITAQSSMIGAPLGMGARMAGMVAAILNSNQRENFLATYKDGLKLLASQLATLDSMGINFMQVLSSINQYANPNNALSINYPDGLPQNIGYAVTLLNGIKEQARDFNSIIGESYRKLFKDETGPNSYAANIAKLNAQQQALLKRSAEGIAGYPSTMKDLNGGFTIAAGVIIENASGGGGNDTITGNAANNTLEGREGNDQINGYLGADILIGGAGRDVFIYEHKDDSSATKGEMDTIIGFTSSDRISFSGLEASINQELNLGTNRSTDDYRLEFIGKKRFSGLAGEIRFTSQRLQIDLNGDRVADMAILLPDAVVFTERNLITMSTIPTRDFMPQDFL
jgi:hypothetical protein